MGSLLIRRHSRALYHVATLVLVGAVLSLAAACSGSSSPPPTATATATATPTVDPVAAYRQDATNLATTLGQQAATTLKDMQSAQTSQSDPKWPNILTADADLVISSASQLKALTVPPSLESVGSDLNAAADKLSSGASLLKQAISTADANAGGQAFTALTDGQTELSAAVAKLK